MKNREPEKQAGVRSAREIAQERADRLHQRASDPERSGPRPAIKYADTIHWEHADQLWHGKVATLGRRGVRAIDRHGREWRVEHGDYGLGLHPSVKKPEPRA